MLPGRPHPGSWNVRLVLFIFHHKGHEGHKGMLCLETYCPYFVFFVLFVVKHFHINPSNRKRLLKRNPSPPVEGIVGRMADRSGF